MSARAVEWEPLLLRTLHHGSSDRQASRRRVFRCRFVRCPCRCVRAACRERERQRTIGAQSAGALAHTSRDMVEKRESTAWRGRENRPDNRDSTGSRGVERRRSNRTGDAAERHRIRAQTGYGASATRRRQRDARKRRRRALGATRSTRSGARSLPAQLRSEVLRAAQGPLSPVPRLHARRYAVGYGRCGCNERSHCRRRGRRQDSAGLGSGSPLRCNAADARSTFGLLRPAAQKTSPRQVIAALAFATRLRLLCAAPRSLQTCSRPTPEFRPCARRAARAAARSKARRGRI